MDVVYGLLRRIKLAIPSDLVLPRLGISLYKRSLSGPFDGRLAETLK